MILHNALLISFSVIVSYLIHLPKFKSNDGGKLCKEQ